MDFFHSLLEQHWNDLVYFQKTWDAFHLLILIEVSRHHRCKNETIEGTHFVCRLREDKTSSAK